MVNGEGFHCCGSLEMVFEQQRQHAMDLRQTREENEVNRGDCSKQRHAQTADKPCMEDRNSLVSVNYRSDCAS